MNIRSMVAAVVGAVVILAAAMPATAQNIDAKEYWLDNGMQVLRVERHEAPTIMASIFARVGSANETTGVKGHRHTFRTCYSAWMGDPRLSRALNRGDRKHGIYIRGEGAGA